MSLAACVARCERVARQTRFPRDEAERLSAANLAAWQAWSMGRPELGPLFTRRRIADSVRAAIGRYGDRPEQVQLTVDPPVHVDPTHDLRLAELLRDLSPEHRRLLALIAYGYTRAEAARIVGISKSRVTQILHTVRERTPQ